MQGPPDSSYASGTFMMYLDLGDEYPRAPPEGRFITPVYHPNINHHGRVSSPSSTLYKDSYS
jgi:ubiquitin-protein ligase